MDFDRCRADSSGSGEAQGSRPSPPWGHVGRSPVQWFEMVGDPQMGLPQWGLRVDGSGLARSRLELNAAWVSLGVRIGSNLCGVGWAALGRILPGGCVQAPLGFHISVRDMGWIWGVRSCLDVWAGFDRSCWVAILRPSTDREARSGVCGRYEASGVDALNKPGHVPTTSCILHLHAFFLSRIQYPMLLESIVYYLPCIPNLYCNFAKSNSQVSRRCKPQNYRSNDTQHLPERNNIFMARL